MGVPVTTLQDGLHIYDTTLRDGVQQRGVTLSVADKLAVAGHLDALGVGFIEGGWPGAVPRDTEFFRRAQHELGLRHAQLAAFGSTRRPGARADRDPQVRALLDAETPIVTLVAKAHDRHVVAALRTTPAENLAMIRDTVRLLTSHGRRVFLDAEHFFDGYLSDARYPLAVVRTAAEAGAEVVVLCDTNGGMLPRRLGEIVASTAAATGVRIGIHCHDDTGCAVANSLVAVDAGATHVQGTANGYGERSGNANLFSLVADLVLKAGRPAVPASRLSELTRISQAIADVVQVPVDPRQPYVGSSAFTHKAGLHASAIKVDPALYQHVDPECVGNRMHLVVSDLAGRALVQLKGAELGYDLAEAPETAARVIKRVKELEACGYSFESAEASFELLLREELTGDGSPGVAGLFQVESWRVITDQYGDREPVCEATVTMLARGERILSTAEGAGPAEALDQAVRAGLARFFPELTAAFVTRYSVRLVPSGADGRTVTRVLLEAANGESSWGTVGVHGNPVVASWEAVYQSIAYALLCQRATERPATAAR
jgi:2-isopropylmalate synthase